MKYDLKKEWPLLVILVIPFLAGIILYPYLPDQVPTHWNIQGEIDSYGSKAFGAFFPPVLNIGMYLLFLLSPKLDPKKQNYAKFESSYLIIRYTIHLFIVLLFAVTMAASLGYPVNVEKWIPAGVAVLFIILGNVMGRIRHNYFVGIRLPWTLASETVWKKTHQLGSKLMVIGGFVALFGAIFTGGAASFIILMAGIFIPIIITGIYSYVIFKQSPR